MENDWKVYRIENRKTHELHYIDGEEHIYDYDENRMLTETEKNAFLYSNENQYERHSGSLKRSKPYGSMLVI